jgi:hypothetical protein
MPLLIPLEPASDVRLNITERLKSQLHYFAQPHESTSERGDDTFRFDLDQVACWLEEGSLRLVSPLDTAHFTEVELSEEQESLLEWLHRLQIRLVRIESAT